MPVHKLVSACSSIAGPCWPFCLLLPVLLCLTFGTMRTLLLPCGHVWGLTMRKCAPCGLERVCSSFNVLIRHRRSFSVWSVSFGNYVPRSLLNATSARLSPFCSAGEWSLFFVSFGCLWFVALCLRFFFLGFDRFTSIYSFRSHPSHCR